MFDKLIREMKKLERGVKVPIQIPLDEKGYMDRLSPSEECESEFKVLFEDWRDKVSDDVVYCPICRFEAQSTEWNTETQQEHIRRTVVGHLKKVVNQAMREDARSFNARQPRGGLISMSMSVNPSHTPILIPPQAAEEMRQEFVCEACGCRYSSLGAAFFCPACGHNSAQTTFLAAVHTVEASVLNIAKIREAVEVAADKDAAANTVRQILENSLVRLVASFQRFAEATFQGLPNASSFRARKNLFQNLGESTVLWRNATGKGYEDALIPSEMADLTVYFQQRHILAHREGIVDQDYIDKSGDRSYSVGQRLVIREQAVLRLAELVNKLAQILG
jgi:rubrerythrin